RLQSTWYGALLRTRSVVREEARARERARELLAYVGLDGKGESLAKNLPYGLQRRLEIARALATDPKLLLLDEPTAGMNPQETVDAMALIKRVRDDLGITILLIEHDMKVVMGISECITVLDYGVKIAEGSQEQVRVDRKVLVGYISRGDAARIRRPKQEVTPGTES